MRISLSRDFIFAFVGFLAGAIAIYTFLKSEFISSFGQNSDELRVIEANFHPRHGFFDQKMKDFLEVVEVHLQVRNFGNETINITSIKTEINNSGLLKFATYGLGSNNLGEDPERNKPVIIKPGETKEIVLSDGIKLEGITPFLESSEFKNEFFSVSGDFYLLHNLSWVDRLNKELALRYGKDATLSISLYEKYKKLIKKHEIRLSEGTDIFDHSGKLQHDRFLGAVRSLHDK